MMPSIYIHIPFCRQACHYCNFHFSVSMRRKNDFLKSLANEIELQKDFFGETINGKIRLDTLYFGGGTPSVLEIHELDQIFTELSKYFLFDDSAEITLEANPDDLTPEKLKALHHTPVNRLSIGIQSFQPNDLKYMNRVHNPQQAMQAIQNAQSTGFKNITADLIYGTPGMSDQQWEKNILTLIKLGIPHISAYSLTVEKKTALDVFIRQGKAMPVDEEQSARQFDILRDITSQHGYEHYEISNFGLPGYFSRHNLNYWTGVPYLGLGPSAHSFKPGVRTWNIANTGRYINELLLSRIPFEQETLTPSQQYNEYIMTALRTMWGIDLKWVEKDFGKDYLEKLMKASKKHVTNQNLENNGTYIKVSRKGKFFTDGIAADLFEV
jgi:oxygen-independent coproporphyrinogen III oxidase